VMIALLLISTAGAAERGEGEVRLGRFLSGLKTMEATLVQTLLNPKKEVIDESEGQFWLSRPGLFRLRYHTPYEQIYVADGAKIWFYDRELEQITVKEQEGALGSTPALLLSGEESLDHSFRVEELGLHSGMQWLNLYPKAADASFDYIRLALEGDELRAIEMVDGFGQTTRLYFDQIHRNPPLEASLFTFVPPPGVDVIGEAE
ncbi:MAG: outer membrane lipoprotein chaperone LolA, partial [Gammaproteobacteria bacterium]|nr:outer membrane lipoprotein chaperone LolA [Gammaproteobacteria bacterium]